MSTQYEGTGPHVVTCYTCETIYRDETEKDSRKRYWEHRMANHGVLSGVRTHNRIDTGRKYAGQGDDGQPGPRQQWHV